MARKVFVIGTQVLGIWLAIPLWATGSRGASLFVLAVVALGLASLAVQSRGTSQVTIESRASAAPYLLIPAAFGCLGGAFFVALGVYADRTGRPNGAFMYIPGIMAIAAGIYLIALFLRVRGGDRHGSR